MKYFLIALMLLVSGCADGPRYYHQCTAYSGHPESFKKMDECIELGKKQGYEYHHISAERDMYGKFLVFYVMTTPDNKPPKDLK